MSTIVDRGSAAEDIRRLAQADERLPEAVVKAFDDAMRSSGRSVQSVFDALAVSDSLAADGALDDFVLFPVTLGATCVRRRADIAIGSARNMETTQPSLAAAEMQLVGGRKHRENA